MQWTAPLQRHRNLPNRDNDGPAVRAILAFAEGLELAKSGRQQAPSITTGLHPKAAVDLLMSAFSLFTSVVGRKAAVDQDRRLRPLLTHNGHREHS